MRMAGFPCHVGGCLIVQQVPESVNWGISNRAPAEFGLAWL